jgi:hypothetical protein
LPILHVYGRKIGWTKMNDAFCSAGTRAIRYSDGTETGQHITRSALTFKESCWKQLPKCQDLLLYVDCNNAAMIHLVALSIARRRSIRIDGRETLGTTPHSNIRNATAIGWSNWNVTWSQWPAGRQEREQTQSTLAQPGGCRLTESESAATAKKSNTPPRSWARNAETSPESQLVLVTP